MKHAETIKNKSRLPTDVLEREADWFAEEINKDRRTVGKYTVKAGQCTRQISWDKHSTTSDPLEFSANRF